MFNYLLDPEGSEIPLMPIERYTRPCLEVNSPEVVEAAKLRGEIARGREVVSMQLDREQSMGVFLNPAKTATVSFTADDQLIVLAQEDS